MPSKDLSKKRTSPPQSSTSVCYCDGTRRLGELELFCHQCGKWFHGTCLRDLKEFYGLPFMVCYVFSCSNCSPSKIESWVAKQANFIHMCVTVLANLTVEQLKESGHLTPQLPQLMFFNLNKHIIPYFNKHWENLTSMPRRVKNTWHGTLQKTLIKEADLFRVDPDDDNNFALNETNLLLVGPAHEAVKQIGKKTSSNNLSSTLVQQAVMHPEESEGPKTRGATKRRTVDIGGGTTKKGKYTADYSSAKVTGQNVDIPFNKEGYRYFLVERDPNVFDQDAPIEEETRAIPAHLYRIATQQFVTLSPNDRAYQLRLSDDQMSVTGYEGYCMSRATHSVAAGTWYFEVQFTRQPPDSHIRIGWSQAYAATQACVGYNKFSYGWRSLKGTKFHNAIGKTYAQPGFKEGDVLGCLISLPLAANPSQYIPFSGKNLPLINFKHNYFYEEKEEVADALKALEVLPGSQIEFFRNGVSCGVAFSDIYRGFYFPAVSLYHNCTVRVNFGPSFAHPPPRGARPMSYRAEELHCHQTLADILYIVEAANPTPSQ